MSVIYNTLTKLKRPAIRDVSPGEFQFKNNARFLKVPKTRKLALVVLVFVALISLGVIGGFYGLYSVREDSPPNFSTANVVITKSISTQQQQNQPAMQSPVNSPEKQMPQYLPPANLEGMRQTASDKHTGRETEMKTAALQKSPSSIRKRPSISAKTKNSAVRNTKTNDSMTSSAIASQADDKKMKLKSRTAENPRRVSVQRSLTISRLIGDLQTAIATGNAKRTDELFEQLVALKGNQNSYVLKLKAYWHLQQGEYQTAIMLLKNVLDRHPDDLEAGINMAILEIKTNRLSAADERLAKLREIHPDDTRITEIMVSLK
ncbi:MAG: tetratricopeptide repeat protein [Desulfobacterales bacterium]|jgi:hypothetical protein